MRTRWATIVAGLLVAAALSGCSGDSDGDALGPPTDSHSRSSSPGVSESASPSPSSTVTPASGTTLTFDDFTIAMPAGWKVDQDASDTGTALEPDAPTAGNILVHAFPRVGSDSLDSFVTQYVKSRNRHGNQLQRLDNRTLDGVEGYVVQGTDPLGDFAYEYGTLTEDWEIHVQFYYRTEGDPSADPFDVIEPVLATLAWT